MARRAGTHAPMVDDYLIARWMPDCRLQRIAVGIDRLFAC